ncbi:MAG: hypothetical protein LUD77_02210 [Clostridiales bacterium]|nr:hypothetical protein [Clostridiales bacterium]
MKRKIALIISAILAVSAMVGCGGGSKGYEYTVEDGSLTITLPNENWVSSGEDTEQGMYMFSLPATSDSAVETGYDSDAFIMYFDLSAERGNMSYETIPTTQEELVESLGEELDYEIISFEGSAGDDGVKSNMYTVKFKDSEGTEGYIVSKASSSETEGYIAAGEVLAEDEELLEDVENAISSIVKNEQ